MYGKSLTHCPNGPKTPHNMFSIFKLSGNIIGCFNWSLGLYLIPTIYGLIFERQLSIKMFFILFEIQILVLQKMLLLAQQITATDNCLELALVLDLYPFAQEVLVSNRSSGFLRLYCTRAIKL